jgi:hypothetical protein
MPNVNNPTVIGVPANVLVGHVQIYIAPVGTAGPATSVGYGSSWGTSWVASGFTEKGLTFSVDRKTNLIYVEELAEPVTVVTDTNAVTLDLEFAEDTLQSMQWAYGGGTITTGTNPTLSLSDNLQQLAVGFEGSAPSGNFRRVIVPTVIATGKVKTSYQRAKAARTYPCTFTSLSPLSAISIVEIGAGAESQ